ncbi:hypothetical protein FACS1894180_7790 [Bacteroidia bacterium]|nr:hypothetical protein FACS1894180_7790 [Bacteroidia bacterium]
MVIAVCGTMAINAQSVYMAAGVENSKQIDFKEVIALNLNSFDAGKVFFEKKMLTNDQTDTKKCNCDLNAPDFIASLALDSKGNIVAMNMSGTQIYRYLQNGEIQTVDISAAKKSFKEGDLFARMTATPDGNIYALDNAGTHFIKIAANEQITDLGALCGFAEIFHNFSDQRSSFGGDMIADDEGNLLVFTALWNVVKIDVKTLSAEFVGTITGLPDGYTVNGVAVTDNNDVILASSQPQGIYTVNPKTLVATYYGENTTPAYDLASNNFLKINSLQDIQNILTLSPTLVKQEKTVFIASQKNFADAIIDIYSVDGRLISKQTYAVKTGDNKLNISALSAGTYIVKVVGKDGNSLLVEKITVE